MSAIWTLFFGWLPAWFQVCILGFLSLIIIIIALKIIALVLDAIPFV